MELTLISANVTSWNKNFAEIVRMKPDIMALQETKVTKTAKPAANRAAGNAQLSVVWGRPCEQLKKKSKGKGIAQTPWLGRQGGAAVLAKKELGMLAGGMEGTTSTDLYESGRYVRAAIPVTHGNRKLFVHVASLYNESTNQNEIAKKMRNERALQRAFSDVAALGDQAFFLCADTNLRDSVAIDDAVMTGNWFDVGTRCAEEDEAAPTFAGFKNWDKHTRGRSVTRPDRILANKIAMEMIKSFEVLRESTLPGHLPLKLTLKTAPLKQRITVVKVPKPFPIEDSEEPEEERSREKAEELVEERKGEIEQALRAVQEEQAWSLASKVAEKYLEWRCSARGNDKPRGGRGRCGQPKTREVSLTASVGERSCDSPATRTTRKIQKARRRATEIRAKMRAKRSDEISTKAEIWRLWQQVKKFIRENKVPCEPVCRKEFPSEGDIQWFLNATQAMIKKIDTKAAEKRIQSWTDRMKRVLNRTSD